MQSAVATALACSKEDVTYTYNADDKSLDVSLGGKELTAEQKTAIATALTEAMDSYEIRQ